MRLCLSQIRSERQKEADAAESDDSADEEDVSAKKQEKNTKVRNSLEANRINIGSILHCAGQKKTASGSRGSAVHAKEILLLSYSLSTRHIRRN